MAANMYSESRGEARDYARVRNACFEQVMFFNCCLSHRPHAYGDEYYCDVPHVFTFAFSFSYMLLVHAACVWVEFAGIRIRLSSYLLHGFFMSFVKVFT
jgi:hypothetical protein